MTNSIKAARTAKAVAFRYTSEDMLRSDTMLTNGTLEWAQRITVDSLSYLNGGGDLMRCFMTGFIEGGNDFKKAFLEVYTNASNFDDNGEAVKKLKNMLDRSMKRIDVDLTVNRKKGIFVWCKAFQRDTTNQIKPYSKGMKLQAAVLAKQSKASRIKNVACLLEDAGLSSSDLDKIKDAMVALETTAG